MSVLLNVRKEGFDKTRTYDWQLTSQTSHRPYCECILWDTFK